MSKSSHRNNLYKNKRPTSNQKCLAGGTYTNIVQASRSKKVDLSFEFEDIFSSRERVII